MSVRSQKKFLETLLREIESQDVEAYRRAIADKQHHTFSLSRRAVRKGMRDYLIEFDPDMPRSEVSSILKTIDKSVVKFIKEVGDNLVELASKDKTVSVTKNTSATKQATFEVKNGKSRYDKIYSRYSKELTVLIAEFGNVVGRVIKGRKVLNLSHKDFEGIIESAVADAVDKAVAQDTLITRKIAESFLRGRGVDLKVVRSTSTSTMNVSLGSSVVNAKDKDASKKRIQDLRKALVDALKELSKKGILLDLPGSDSFAEIKEKKIINSTLKPFRSVKGAKVSKAKKIKHSKKTSSKKKTGSATIIATKAKARRSKARQAKKAGASSQPLELLGILNQKLPQTVRKNMQTPALVNRSGRFAESVKVTEITQTPQGFPSVGYTYQRNPYQVFEEGSSGNWSNGDRDPRDLIDKSIREIAVHFAIGRFYTRRV